MEEQGRRYNFNMRKGYVWRDMLTNKHHFWSCWGVKQTLKYLFNNN